MYEKGSPVKVTVEIGEQGIKEMEFVGKVVIDGSDFMAVQFDTIIIPKMDIKTAEPIPGDEPLEQILGAERMSGDGVERPTPPRVDNVRFLPVETESPVQKPKKPTQQSSQQQPKK